MSIANELNRLLQAKSDLATSIENKGVTVPAATTLDGYAALVDQIQQGGGTLPYDAEIEYLESTGTQYIDTQETMTYDGVDFVEFSVNIAITSNASRQLNGDGVVCYFGVNASNKFEIHATGAITYDSGYHNWYVSCKGGKTMYGVIDGTSYQAGNAANNNKTYNLYLFAIGGNVTSPSASLFIKQKLKNAVIKKNGEVVRCFIPVRKGTVGYLYDKVSGILFGNSGTGSFTLGPDVT